MPVVKTLGKRAKEILAQVDATDREDKEDVLRILLMRLLLDYDTERIQELRKELGDGR